MLFRNALSRGQADPTTLLVNRRWKNKSEVIRALHCAKAEVAKAAAEAAKAEVAKAAAEEVAKVKYL